jgi:hypothetical protein
MKRIKCILFGHKPDKVHGFHNEAAFGAVCLRCNYKFETYSDWQARWKR